MEKNIHNNIFWIVGIVILALGMFLYFIMPDMFKNLELVLGVGLVFIGIVMIYQIFKPVRYGV